MKKTYFVVALGLVLSISACGNGMDGKYSDKNNMVEFEFKSGSKVIVSAMGMGREAKYTKDGDSIKLDFGAENLILKIGNDGCIQYPMIGSLCKSK